jgi:hypothetical protein
MILTQKIVSALIIFYAKNIFTTNHQYIYNNKLTTKPTFYIWVFTIVPMPKIYLQQIDNIFTTLINNENNN